MQSPRVEMYLEFVNAMADCDKDALAAMINPDRFIAYLPGSPQEGMDFSLFMAELAKLHQVFGDFASRKDYEHFMVCNRDVIAVCSMEMSHEGPLSWATDSPPLEATGKPVGMNLIEIISFDPESKVTEFRMSGDRLSVLEQLAA